MKASFLPYRTTGFFSNLATDYLAGSSALDGLYAHRPDWDQFATVIDQKKKVPINRPVLVGALNRQYEALTVQEAVAANLRALAEENTFTVTTGHQLCLLTGPLYFLYKIVSTIRLTQQLAQRFPGNRFVPVYWMASEDHDFAEINHVHLFGKTLSWEADASGPVGWLPTGTLESVLNELEPLLGDRDTSVELNRLFRDAYLQHENLAEATRYLVNELFGRYGLVIIDGDDNELKRLFAPAMKDELLHQPSVDPVHTDAAKLREAGYKVQVNPRDINLFFLGEGFRERLVRDGEVWRVNNTDISFTEAELLAELDRHPALFSPNVILRPVYQETILPNLAYIGGGGELAYWLELKGVFEHFQVPLPMLLLRNSVLWVDPGSGKKLDKLGITAQDLFADLETLKKQWIADQADHELSVAAERSEIERVYDRLVQKAVQIDPTLEGAVEGEKARQLKALDGLEKRLVKAEKQKHEVSLGQLEKLQSKLFPNGGLQERYDNFIPLYLRHGHAFIDQLLNTLEPMGLQFTVIEE